MEKKMVPCGALLPWSGLSSQVPEGWALCDGKAGRPDLRDQFVVQRKRPRVMIQDDIAYEFAYIMRLDDVEVVAQGIEAGHGRGRGRGRGRIVRGRDRVGRERRGRGRGRIVYPREEEEDEYDEDEEEP